MDGLGGDVPGAHDVQLSEVSGVAHEEVKVMVSEGAKGWQVQSLESFALSDHFTEALCDSSWQTEMDKKTKREYTRIWWVYNKPVSLHLVATEIRRRIIIFPTHP